MSPSRLARCIVPPNKLVQTLNWKNPSVLLALNITDESIGISYAAIPRSDDGRIHHHNGSYDHNRSIFESYEISNGVQRLNPIPYMPSKASRGQICRRDETIRISDDIYELSMDLKASGFLVSWPLTENGRMGKDCGKVLHVLDGLAERGKGPAISRHRPCCLWDFDKSRCQTVLHNGGNWFDTNSGRSKAGKSSANLLVPEKMAKKLIGQEQRKRLEARAGRQNKSVVDESDLAAFVLQEFINLNWKPLQSQLSRRDAEAQLFRNKKLNTAFSEIDEPDKQQLHLLN